MISRRWSLSVAALAVCCLTACDAAAPPASSAPPTPIAIPAPATATREAASRERPPTPASSERYDLAADERRGGHTLERHVGRTDEQLRERLRREPNISAASTYEDRETAEAVIFRAFRESAATVERWRARSGRRPNLVLDRDEPAAIGRSLRRGARAAAPCDHAVVVLRWDERADSSYVLTSYPECGR